MFLSLLLSLGLAAVHLFGGRLRFVDAIPRSVWLSGAGGASVAYVFVHLLPELAEHQETLAAASEGLAFLKAHVWLVALLGLSVFYGLERAGQVTEEPDASEAAERRVYWLRIGSFALYNAIIGYLLLHREDPTLGALLIYASAMALHFVVNDYGLRQDHPRLYWHTGRWVLAAAVVAGCVAAAFVTFSEVFVAALVAFLGGGVVLNVLKEELPDDRKSRFWPFAVGAAAYAALLLLTL